MAQQPEPSKTKMDSSPAEIEGEVAEWKAVVERRGFAAESQLTLHFFLFVTYTITNHANRLDIL